MPGVQGGDGLAGGTQRGGGGTHGECLLGAAGVSTAAVRRYWTQIAAMGCICCGSPAHIAHAHGESLIVYGRTLGRDYQKAKGKKLPYMDWLVLPICPRHHIEASDSLDKYPEAWEDRWGPVVYWLNIMVERTGVNIWALAKSRHELMEVA